MITTVGFLLLIILVGLAIYLVPSIQTNALLQRVLYAIVIILFIVWLLGLFGLLGKVLP